MITSNALYRILDKTENKNKNKKLVKLQNTIEEPLKLEAIITSRAARSFKILHVDINSLENSKFRTIILFQNHYKLVLLKD